MRRLVIIASIAATLAGCGAQPAMTAAPTRQATAAEAKRAPRPVFKFADYEVLSAEERRVLEASTVSVGDGETLTGAALFAHWVAKEPKFAANFLNQTAVLASTLLPDGSTALSHVIRIEGVKINHVYAEVSPALMPLIARSSATKHRPDVAYVGPEDSSLLHGKYNTSYRENRPYTSQQFCFSAQDGFTKVDIDLDEECPLAGSRVALAQHLIRAIKHEILRKWPGSQYGENSEPDYFHRVLTLTPTQPDGKPNKLGRGLKLPYELVSR